MIVDEDADPFSILIVIEAPIATTQIVEQVIGACRQHGIRSATRLLRDLRPEEIAPNVLPLFIRCADPTSLPWARALVAHDRPYLYYLDDDFWGLNDGSPLALYYSDPSVRRSLDYFVGNAQAVLTNSTVLAEVLRARARAIEVLPTFFDFSLLPDVEPTQSNEIRIGFAGSSSRVGDLELISPMVQPLIGQFPNVVFEFAGAFPKGIVANDRVRYFPPIESYPDFIRFKASRGWSIGLAPLQDRPANLAKTDNKFREYGACRIAGIYSSSRPYTDVVADGVTGVLVENTADAWREAVIALILEPQRRASIASAAYQHVRKRYDLNSAARIWAASIERIASPLRLEAAAPSAEALRRERLSAVANSLWLRVRMSYAAGGLGLVMKRAVRMVANRVR